MNRKRSDSPLKHWREEKQFDQMTAAAYLRVSQGYLSRLERQQQFPRRKLAKAISDKTGVSLEAILGLV